MDQRHRRTTNSLTVDGRTTEAEEPVDGGRGLNGRSNSTRKVTVTSHSQKVVTRRSAAGGSKCDYEIDPWERTPKTDYTYANSRSYLKQPTDENYVSPNMSRRSLRGGSARGDEYSPNSIGHSEFCIQQSSRNEFHSKHSQNLEFEESFGGRRHGVRSEGSDITEESTSGRSSQKSMADDEYMRLRSRTLMTPCQSTGWQNNDTFKMRNLHGTDVEEEEMQGTSAAHSTVGNHGDHTRQELKAVLVGSQTIFNQFTSFLVTIVQTCVTVITYLPKKASTFFSRLSSAAVGEQCFDSTKRQRSAVTTTTASTQHSTSTLKAVLVTNSRWTRVRDALHSVVHFLLVTLPLGLVSWALFGVISSIKVLRQSSTKVWHWFEKVLYSTVTKATRVTDAAIMSKTSSLRRRCGCCCLFPFLIILPIFFVGLLYGSSCPKDVAIVGFVRDQFSAYFLPLTTSSDVPLSTITHKDIHKENVESSQGDALAIAVLEERMRGLLSGFLADQKTTTQLDQDRALNAFRAHIDRLVKLLVQRELLVQKTHWNVQINSIKSAAHDDRVHLLGEQNKQMSVIISMRAALDDLVEKARRLSDDLTLVKKTVTDRPVTTPQPLQSDDRRFVDLEDHLMQLNEEFSLLKAQYKDLASQMLNRPSNDDVTLLIKTRVREYFTQLMGDDDHAANAGQTSTDDKVAFGAWLSQRFAARDDLDERLAALAAKITKEFNEKMSASKEDPVKLAAAVAAIITDSTSKEKALQKEGGAGTFIFGASDSSTLAVSAPCTLCDGMLAEADVLKLIQIELGIYDADKTGKVDFALESAGGSVVSVRCSETYQLRTAQTSVFGVPLWYTYNSPRVIIQPGMQPGECWAFTGSEGYVVVQLSRQTFVTEVSIEHIPKSLAPTGHIDSAPKDCEVLGLENETDTAGRLIVDFTYKSDGSSIQTFKTKDPTAASYKFIELKVKSNHGNDRFTCLYRLRVHGYLDHNSA